MMIEKNDREDGALVIANRIANECDSDGCTILNARETEKQRYILRWSENVYRYYMSFTSPRNDHL